MTTLDFAIFPELLRDQVPGFDRVYNEHVRDYDQILPHVLLGDLVRFLSDEIHSHGENSAALRLTMDLLERAMGSADPMLQELVAVSFLENLDPGDSSYAVIMKSLGPRLRDQYEKYQKTTRAP